MGLLENQRISGSVGDSGGLEGAGGPASALKMALMPRWRKEVQVCVKQMDEVCRVVPWQACVIIPRKKMESFVGELAAVLILASWLVMELCVSA